MKMTFPLFFKKTSFVPSFTHKDRVSHLACLGGLGGLGGPRRIDVDMVGEHVVDDTLAGLEPLPWIVIGTKIQGRLRGKGQRTREEMHT